MLFRNLEKGLFLVLTILFSAYAQELETLCGKTHMEVTNKKFSFVWKISGYGDRINDTSSFSMETDKIVFNDVGSSFWKFYFVKRGHGFISLSAVAMNKKQDTQFFPTIYSITPTISVGDQESQLDTVVSPSRTVTHNQWSTQSFFNNIPKHFEKVNNQLFNLTKHIQFMTGQNRMKRSEPTPEMVVSPEEKATLYDTPMHGMRHGFFAFNNIPNPGKTSTWQNIFPQLSGILAQTDGSKEMKIKFLIEAKSSTIEYSTPNECN